MFSNQRFPPHLQTRIAAILAIVAMFILTASLPYLNFQPGQVLVSEEHEHEFTPLRVRFNSTLLTSICLSGIVVMMPAGVILLIFSSEARRLFRKYAKVLLIWFIILLVLRFYMILTGNQGMIYESSGAPANLSDSFEPPSDIGVASGYEEVYVPPEVNGWQGYLVGFIVIVLLGVIGYLWWEKNWHQEEELGSITLRAIREITSGRHWEDAVIECYIQMNASVSSQLNLDRQQTMTPGEFSQVLVSSGLPGDPVMKLTQLFEQARYGNRISNRDEAKDAVRCLTEINQALVGSG